MTKDIELIVLGVTKTGERAAVVHTLSREYGRRGFYIRGVGNNAMMTCFLPMSIIECEVAENTKSKLYSARKPALVHPLHGIRGNMYKNAIALFMSEVLYRIVKDGTFDHGLYDWCRSGILLLDAIDKDYSNFHVRFLLELAVMLGFAPSAEALAPFAGEDSAVMEKFMKLSFSESMLVPLSGEVRCRLSESVLKYIEYHTESAVNVRSISVLHEIFA